MIINKENILQYLQSNDVFEFEYIQILRLSMIRGDSLILWINIGIYNINK